MRFRPHQRIRHRREYLEAREHGTYANCGPFILRLHKRQHAPEAPARLGVIATKKVGKAHQRNRAKRLFREIFRTTQDEAPAGIDIVIVARSSYANYPMDELKARYRKGLERLLTRLNQTPDQ